MPLYNLASYELLIFVSLHYTVRLFEFYFRVGIIFLRVEVCIAFGSITRIERNITIPLMYTGTAGK